MADLVVAFQAVEEFERLCRALDAARAPYRAVEPPPAIADVAAPYVVISDESRGAVHAAVQAGSLIAGQVWYRAPTTDALADLGPEPPAGSDDAVGRIAIAFVAPCTAEEDHLRLTAQVQNDLGPVMPYLNAVLRGGTFTAAGPTFTFMDGPRLINLQPHRMAVARAREMQDAWRTLARAKRVINEIWSRRESIKPSYERRVQVSALEVYSRLPRTNCRQCGEATCLAFAAKLLNGAQRLENCAPVFGGGRHERLRQALLDLAAGLGL
jgi:ArsR family metal-binding transcriptional regulator